MGAIIAQFDGANHDILARDVRKGAATPALLVHGHQSLAQNPHDHRTRFAPRTFGVVGRHGSGFQAGESVKT